MGENVGLTLVLVQWMVAKALLASCSVIVVAHMPETSHHAYSSLVLLRLSRKSTNSTNTLPEKLLLSHRRRCLALSRLGLACGLYLHVIPLLLVPEALLQLLYIALLGLDRGQVLVVLLL